MDSFFKYLFGCGAACVALFSPIQTLVMCALLFIAIDFVTGVWASYIRAKRSGMLEDWGFESDKAWNTIRKIVFVITGIAIAWLLEAHVLDFMNIRIAKIFTGFVCGVEAWSYLENGAEISNHPVFRFVKKFVAKQIEDKTGVDITEKEDKEKGAE